ncbi:DUF1795 domain-containing protein [Myxococcota bacterium]|nr:DUF1795 domain-containing protein [Myxococcota bacterium]
MTDAAKIRVTLGSFSLEASQDWTLSTVILAGPMDETAPGAGMPTTKAVRPFQRNLVATMEQVEPSTSLEAYVKRQVDGLRQAGVQRQEAAKPERVKLASGLDGLITEQIILGNSGERVRQMQLVCIKNGLAHTVIASHLDGKSFEAARESFRGMLLSFA